MTSFVRFSSDMFLEINQVDFLASLLLDPARTISTTVFRPQPPVLLPWAPAAFNSDGAGRPYPPVVGHHRQYPLSGEWSSGRWQASLNQLTGRR